MIWTPTDEYMARDYELFMADRKRELRERFATFPYEAPQTPFKPVSSPSAAQLEADYHAELKARQDALIEREINS